MDDDDRGHDENGEAEPGRQSERAEESMRDRAREEQAMGGDLGGRLGDLDDALATLEYPTTTDELVEEVGDTEVETKNGTATVEEVLAPTDNQRYESADDVRARILGLIRR